MQDGAGQSHLSLPVWQALQSLDPRAEEEEATVTLAACLALAEQRFLILYRQVLARLGESSAQELGAEADILADAHHTLTLLQDSLHVTSRRMLDVLDRVSRELGE